MKKIILNKETVRQLDEKDLRRANGGGKPDGPTCWNTYVELTKCTHCGITQKGKACR